jgi:prevent-host-death family protein
LKHQIEFAFSEGEMETDIAATQARIRFGEVMRRAAEKHERFLVQKDGVPQVVILSVDDYQSMKEAARGRAARAMEHARMVREKIRGRLGDRLMPVPEEVLKETREERDDTLPGLR